jgi:hypothetical protein
VDVLLANLKILAFIMAHGIALNVELHNEQPNTLPRRHV